jgi:hypothetical protein
MPADSTQQTTQLAGPNQVLNEIIKQGYPAQGTCIYTRTINVPEGQKYSNIQSLYDYPGFSTDVVQSETMVDLVRVSIRTISLKTGVVIAMGLTANASAGSSLMDIFSMKTCEVRRTTDLTMGMETHSLPLHIGMSSMIKPVNVSGLHPYLALNISGEATVSVMLEYQRGSGCIGNSAITVGKSP